MSQALKVLKEDGKVTDIAKIEQEIAQLKKQMEIITKFFERLQIIFKKQ